ncbi:MAG TPA: hypothetical protein VJN18_11135 [Polyangiaceae bacterium]|nr:hypothetical protein [Polyangiaceae bacterium]
MITFSFRVRVATNQRKPMPGRCIGCGCTDEYGCEQGCSWADGDHLLCSVCFASLAGVPVEPPGDHPGPVRLMVAPSSWRQVTRGQRR